MLTGVQPRVMRYIERAGLDAEIGQENFFWSSAIARFSWPSSATC